ncbi:MAG TPA: hypothetical protein VF715_13785 [Thermoleophilaceae bacterium]
MAIDLMSVSNVSRTGPVPTCTDQSPPSMVEQFLEEHVDKLRSKAAEDGTGPASFDGSHGKADFQALLTGSKADFMKAAQHLATELHTAMGKTGNAADGTFVVLRLDGGSTAAVLKLQVISPHGGYLDAQQQIQAIENLLDVPGGLQKGAVVPDPRKDSDVIVGDKLGADASLYFLQALGVRQHQTASAGALSLMRIASEVMPGKHAEIAQAVAAAQNQPVKTLIDKLEPTAAERVQLSRRLNEERRPIVKVDSTGVRLTRTLSGDGIEIKGPVTEMDKRVKIDGNVATVTFSKKPESTF